MLLLWWNTKPAQFSPWWWAFCFRCAWSSSIRSKRKSANFHFLRNMRSWTSTFVHQLFFADSAKFPPWISCADSVKGRFDSYPWVCWTVFFCRFSSQLFGDKYQASSGRHKQSTQHCNEQWEVSPETKNWEKKFRTQQKLNSFFPEKWWGLEDYIYFPIGGPFSETVQGRTVS